MACLEDVGRRVVIGGAKEGLLRYFGPLHLRPDEGDFCGIELLEAAGRHDGCVDGRRYFAAPAGHGIFAPPARVQVLASPTLTESAPSHLDDSGLGTSAIHGAESPEMEEAPPGLIRRQDTFDLDAPDELIADETPLDSLSSSSAQEAEEEPLGLDISLSHPSESEDPAILTPIAACPSPTKPSSPPPPHPPRSPEQQENRPPPRKKPSRNPLLAEKPPPRVPKPRQSLMEALAASAPPPKPRPPKPLSKAQLIQLQLKESMAKEKLKPKKEVKSKLVSSLAPPKARDEPLRSRSDSGASNLTQPETPKKMPISSARVTERKATTMTRAKAPPKSATPAPAANGRVPSAAKAASSSIPPPNSSATRNGTAKTMTTTTTRTTKANGTAAAPTKTPSARANGATPSAAKAASSTQAEELRAAKEELARLDAEAKEALEKVKAELKSSQEAAKSATVEAKCEAAKKARLSARLGEAAAAAAALATALQLSERRRAAARVRGESRQTAWALEKATLITQGEEERRRAEERASKEATALKETAKRELREAEAKAEAAVAELDLLGDRYSQLNQQHQKLAATMAKDGEAKLQHALKELHSYKEVNELQAQELKDFRAKVAKLEAKVDSIPGLESKMASQALELADLRAQMGRKKEMERHLSQTNALLAQEKASAELMTNSILMEKEELEYRLEQMSQSLQEATSSPRTSLDDPMTSSVYGADAFNRMAANATKVLKTRTPKSAEKVAVMEAPKRLLPTPRAPLRPKTSSEEEATPPNSARSKEPSKASKSDEEEKEEKAKTAAKASKSASEEKEEKANDLKPDSEEAKAKPAAKTLKITSKEEPVITADKSAKTSTAEESNAKAAKASSDEESPAPVTAKAKTKGGMADSGIGSLSDPAPAPQQLPSPPKDPK